MHYEVLFVVYLYYFLVTNLLELPVVLLWSRLAFDKQLKRAVWVGILCQVATHPFFVGLPFVVTAIMGESSPDWLRYLQEHDLLKETLLIPLIEAAIYWVLLKPLKTWQALAISYSANLVSWGIGLFISSAWIYRLMLPEV